MAQQNGRSDNEGMAEFAKQLWERYMRQRVISDLLKHSLDGYKAQVVSNNGDGTLTVIRPYDAQSVTLKCPPALAAWAAAGDQVLVVSLGDASNSFILCATDIDGFDLDILSNQDPLMNAADAEPGTSNEASRADHVHPSDTSRVPTSRTINGYDLTQNRTLTAADVGALPADGTSVASNTLAAAHTISGSAGWYKVLEITLTSSSAAQLTMYVADNAGPWSGLLQLYYNRTNSAFYSALKWQAITSFLPGDARYTLDQSTGLFTLYINKQSTGGLTFQLLRSMTRTGATLDVSGMWNSTTVSEPTTATPATGPTAQYDINGEDIDTTYVKKSSVGDNSREVTLLAGETRVLTFDTTNPKGGMLVLAGPLTTKAGLYIFGGTTTMATGMQLVTVKAVSQSGMSVTASGATITVVNGSPNAVYLYIMQWMGNLPTVTDPNAQT